MRCKESISESPVPNIQKGKQQEIKLINRQRHLVVSSKILLGDAKISRLSVH